MLLLRGNLTEIYKSKMILEANYTLHWTTLILAQLRMRSHKIFFLIEQKIMLMVIETIVLKLNSVKSSGRLRIVGGG